MSPASKSAPTVSCSRARSSRRRTPQRCSRSCAGCRCPALPECRDSLQVELARILRARKADDPRPIGEASSARVLTMTRIDGERLIPALERMAVSKKVARPFVEEYKLKGGPAKHGH